MTFVTSATNAEVSQAQPYCFQSNAPSIHRAFHMPLVHQGDQKLFDLHEAGYNIFLNTKEKSCFVMSPPSPFLCCCLKSWQCYFRIFSEKNMQAAPPESLYNWLLMP